MARKPASRSTAAASTTTFSHLTNTATFSAQSPPHNVAYPLSAAASVAGGTAPVDSPPAPEPVVMRKRSQPKSKNHGRFPCSIPGCFAVANHLSSMCRHKWGHLPQRLLPACRGHLPSGAPCPVRYQGRADTMKRHWLTHHTAEGPWVPDRYPPFEDLWRLVQEGEIVLSPPSKYPYDSPDPEQAHTLAGTPRPSSGGGTPLTSSGRRNSVGLGTKLQVFTKLADASIRDELAGRSRSHSYSGRSARQIGGERGPRDMRFSKGNTKPWRISEPASDVVEDEDDEVDELDLGTVDGDMMDVEMDNATSDASGSPSRHSHPSLRHSPAYPHSIRSQRSPRSPASVHSFPAEHEQVEVDIHVPYATIPPITSLSPAPTEAIITRNPLHPTANYPVLQPSNFREHTITYSSSYLRHHGHTKSKDAGVLGLLALSQEFHAGENRNPNVPGYSFGTQSIKMKHNSNMVAGAYVYGHGKGTPPSTAFTPASIPPSELSLLSHPPTDRILPSSPHHPLGELQTMQLDATADSSPYPPMRVSPDIDRRPLSRTSYETWHTHGQTLIRPFTVASH